MNDLSDRGTVYDLYILSADWFEKAAEAKERAHNRCQICYMHENDVILDAHHRTYDRLGRELPEDITVLCRDCHELFTRYDRLAKFGTRELLGKREAKALDVAAVEYLDEIKESSVESISTVGPVTGLLDIDGVLGGFENSALITVAARPGMGKSSLVNTIAINAAIKSRKRVIIFSLQSPLKQVLLRMLTIITQIDYQRLKAGRINDDEQLVITKVAEDLKQAPLLIDDTPRLTPMDIRIECHRQFGGEGLDFAIVDGLELMEPELHLKQPPQRITESVRSLKTIARELNIPIVITHQLNAKVEQRQDKRPLLSDLTDSGHVVKYSDVVMLIYRDGFYRSENTDRPNIAEINIAKHRTGPTAVVDVFWNERLMTFNNLQRQEITL